MRVGVLATVCLVCGLLSPETYAGTGPPQDTGKFEDAVSLIKRYEGWHGNHLPYIGYGHRLLPGERLPPDITEEQADSLLREDLRKLCTMFRKFGKDSLLLSEISDNRSYPNPSIILKI